MKKPMTAQQRCYYIMTMSRFTYEKRRESLIWAAKENTCPSCHVCPFTSCLNVTDVRAGKSNPRVNQVPHHTRVNWEKLLQALKDRGY